ncbi:hypothetical protein GCM10009665_05430 [Kitasatospora nipponensis]|uniref:Uncharacterized protein n=1 Tax=Kitasatospora nipponensis TaxID=258049 RepID=A0ABP4G9T9_9ACTN
MDGTLGWLTKAFDTGFSVTFAEGLDARTLLLRMGCEPESIDWIDEVDCQGRQLDDDIVMIRAGVHGGWAFAVQAWGARALEGGVMAAVSAGTRACTLVSTMTIPWFAYWEDAEPICDFDPGMPSTRHGTAPDHLNPVMAQVGLDPSPDATGSTSVSGMLLLAERAFGVTLPYEAVFQGELLGGVVPG